MFGIKGRDTFNKPLSDRAQLARIIKEKWLKYFPYFLVFLIISAMTFLGYVWYVYVYTKELSEEEKTTYVNEKRQAVIFRQKKFDELKGLINARQDQYNAGRTEKRDFFYHLPDTIVEAEEEQAP